MPRPPPCPPLTTRTLKETRRLCKKISWDPVLVGALEDLVRCSRPVSTTATPGTSFMGLVLSATVSRERNPRVTESLCR